VIRDLERRLEFLEKDGTIRELEARIEGLEMEKAAIEKENVMKKQEIAFRRELMLNHNQMLEKQESLLAAQAGAIQELNEEVKAGKNCVTLVGAVADRISLQNFTLPPTLPCLYRLAGLKQIILEKEDENQRLEEIIQTVKMEKETVTHNNTMMQEEMVRRISERENVIRDLERRLEFLEKDGTIRELEARIEGLEMEKAAIEKENVMKKQEIAFMSIFLQHSSQRFEKEKKEIICEAPWTQLSTGCYRFHTAPMTQSEAKKFCEEEQQVPSHLIEIDSAEENRAVVAEMKRQNFLLAFWLGINDRHSEGHWVLESTGKSVVFANWRSGEPNNAGSEDCAHINDTDIFKWNDVPCNFKMRALCEM